MKAHRKILNKRGLRLLIEFFMVFINLINYYIKYKLMAGVLSEDFLKERA
jgi:hypothetical protein